MSMPERKINIHKGFTGLPMRQVTCPECNQGGGSEYPCYCHRCHESGEDVMMLPSSNGRIVSNWCEVLPRV